jgi:hypothetical protein
MHDQGKVPVPMPAEMIEIINRAVRLTAASHEVLDGATLERRARR